MHLDEYQALAARTLNSTQTAEQRLANGALGLTGEAGEVAEHVKKHLFHATPLDRDAVAKELGDCLWYLASLATSLDLSLADVAALNVAKLQRRYPEGFSAERSRDRVE